MRTARIVAVGLSAGFAAVNAVDVVSVVAVAGVVGASATPAYAQEAPPDKPLPQLGGKLREYAKALLKVYHLHDYPEAGAQLEKARKDLEGLEGYAWKGLSDALNKGFVPMRRPAKSHAWLGDDKDNGIKIDGFPCSYEVATPKGYSANKPWPLLVALHGGGEGAGSGSEAMSTMGTHMRAKALVAAPTAPGLPNGAWAYPRGQRTTRAIIKEMAERYNIDHNRIYVGGHSMGGYGGYWHAVWWPDRFAAYTSAAGGISAGAVNDFEILYNTPLYVVHGMQDTRQAYWSFVKKADDMIRLLPLQPQWYRFVGIPDAGHGFASTYHKAACDWMWSHVRNPYPPKVVCTVPRVFNIEAVREMPGTEPGGRCFWVEILDRNGRDNDHAAKVVAEYDAKKNLVTVTTPYIKRVAQKGGDDPDSKIIDMGNFVTRIGICLSDDMMDLSKPVTITCNGTQVFQGRVQRSVDFLLETMVATGDPAMAFACRVDFDAVNVPANPWGAGEDD